MFRYSYETWKTIETNLIQFNKADASITTETYIPSYAINSFKYVWKIEKINSDSWNLVGGNNMSTFLKKMSHVPQAYAYGTSKGSGTYLWVSFYQLYKRINSLGVKYKTYVLTRTDFYYLCPYAVPQKKCVHVSKIESYGGVNDRHIVIPYYYLHILKVMEFIKNRYQFKKLWCSKCYTEHVILKVFKYYKVPTCFYDLTMFLVRDNNTHVRSHKGVGKKVSCNGKVHNVKYINELKYASSNCNIKC